MLKPTLTLALAAGLALPAAAQDTEPVDASGTKAPKIFEIGKPVDLSITLKDIDGKEHRLADYEGKTVVLDFWSNRCPWSRKAEPALIALQKAFAGQDVVLLAIDSNMPELADGERDGFKEIRDYNRKSGVTYPILLDPGNVIADRFRAKATPHLFVIDRHGVLRYDGGIDDDPRGTKGDQATPWARNAIAAVVAGEKVAEPKTKAFGCTIKRVKKRVAQ